MGRIILLEIVAGWTSVRRHCAKPQRVSSVRPRGAVVAPPRSRSTLLVDVVGYGIHWHRSLARTTMILSWGGDRDRRGGLDDLGRLDGCGPPRSACGGCGGLTGLTWVGTGGGGWVGHFLRVVSVVHSFWSISSGLNGGVGGVTSRCTLGVGGSDRTGTCGVGACCWRFGVCCGKSCWSWWIWGAAWLASCWFCSAEIWAWVWAWDCACWRSWVSPPQNCPTMPWWGRVALATEFHIECSIWSGLFGVAPIQAWDCQGNGNMAGVKFVRYKIIQQFKQYDASNNQCKGSWSGSKALGFPSRNAKNSWRVQPSNWCTTEPYQRP